MTPQDFFIPATITKLKSIDLGEIRELSLTLPQACLMDGQSCPIGDDMRPGTAFLAKPFGARTQKFRRKMYTRSNCSKAHQGVLETVVNHTHGVKADSSAWWQSREAEDYRENGRKIEVLVRFYPERSECLVYENALHCDPHNLRLEPDGEWEDMNFLAIALSTGITPFLAYLRYMKALNFGKSEKRVGAHLTLIASAKRFTQLIAHEELLDLEKKFKPNFRYFPVLTREWPEDWKYPKGRIMKVREEKNGQEKVSIEPLLEIVPDLKDWHLRFCGGKVGRGQLENGMKEVAILPLSFRSEVW